MSKVVKIVIVGEEEVQKKFQHTLCSRVFRFPHDDRGTFRGLSSPTPSQTQLQAFQTIKIQRNQNGEKYRLDVWATFNARNSASLFAQVKGVNILCFAYDLSKDWEEQLELLKQALPFVPVRRGGCRIIPVALEDDLQQDVDVKEELEYLEESQYSNEYVWCAGGNRRPHSFPADGRGQLTESEINLRQAFIRLIPKVEQEQVAQRKKTNPATFGRPDLEFNINKGCISKRCAGLTALGVFGLAVGNAATFAFAPAEIVEIAFPWLAPAVSIALVVAVLLACWYRAHQQAKQLELDMKEESTCATSLECGANEL